MTRRPDVVETLPIDSIFRVMLLSTLAIIIAIYIADKFLYPHAEILPEDFFFAVTIVNIFFIWFDGLKEKERILWIKKRTEELNEMKSKFTLMTSHELMTPITMIKGYIELMLDKMMGELTDKQKEALRTMNKYFKRLEKIKDSLTELHSGITTTFHDSLKPFSIEVLIETLMEDMATFLKRRNQTLSYDIEKGLGPIMMNTNGIRQVLVNLILNAIRFTPDHGKIVIRARDGNDHIRVEVEDNGIGIPEDKLESIFESFYEAHNTDEHSTGTIEFKSGGIGIGLTIARNIITAHRGRIWAESEPGKFSRFIFTLPKQI